MAVQSKHSGGQHRITMQRKMVEARWMKGEGIGKSVLSRVFASQKSYLALFHPISLVYGTHSTTKTSSGKGENSQPAAVRCSTKG